MDSIRLNPTRPYVADYVKVSKNTDHGLSILYYGPMRGNSRSRVEGLVQLGHEVTPFCRNDPFERAPRWIRSIEWRLTNGPLTLLNNWLLEREAMLLRPDVVWVEMGKLVYAETLHRIKRQTGCLMMNSYSDDFLDPSKRSRHYMSALRIYDCVFTPREENIEEMQKRGARKIYKFWKGFDPLVHFPQELEAADRRKFETDVVFVGHGEPARLRPLNKLARKISSMKVWGHGWHRYHLPGPLSSVVQGHGPEDAEYRKALCGAKIALNLLSRWARDTQNSRSFEIPACGVMMLAERTKDHETCFEEDKEAVFFDDDDELVDKVIFYLKHDTIRRRIAAAGRERCLRSGYSNHARVAVMLEHALEGIERGPRTRPGHDRLAPGMPPR